ncbi:MAG: NADH-quinone oxidoreductase subunit K [Elusimicrobiota bacterium]
MEYFLCMVLFGVGFYALIAKKNLVKMIIGIAIMDYAVNLLFILIGYRKGADIPILMENAASGPMVDPLAQSIVLITIIIGLSVTILLVSLAIRLHEKYGTFDITEYKKLKG